MKTKNTSNHSELKNRPEQPVAATAQSRPERPYIDFKKRNTNRGLDTASLLNLLRTEAPRFFELAQVVGKWVWIQFDAKQPPEITCQLAEFGFHWNNKRQCWQHPCGPVTRSRVRLIPARSMESIFPLIPRPRELETMSMLIHSHPFRLREGDTVDLDGQACRVLRVTESAAVVAVARPVREFTTMFGKHVRIQPKPALIRISPNSEIPILNR